MAPVRLRLPLVRRDEASSSSKGSDARRVTRSSRSKAAFVDRYACGVAIFVTDSAELPAGFRAMTDTA